MLMEFLFSILIEKPPYKPKEALEALKEIREDAQRRGLDKMTFDEINEEFRLTR